MGNCVGSKTKQESILKDIEPARTLVQNKGQSQFKYPDLNYQSPNNIDPSKLQQAKVSILPSNVRPQSLVPDPPLTANHQNAAGASKIPFAQSVVNVLPPSNVLQQSNLPHQSLVVNHSEVPIPSNVHLPHVSNIQKAVQPSNLRELQPHYSKIPSQVNKDIQIKISSNIAHPSNIPHNSAIPPQQQINKASEISLDNRRNPHPQSKYLSQLKGQQAVSDEVPRQESSINGVIGDMKSRIESGIEGNNIIKSNIGFKQRSGIEHVFVSEAVKQRHHQHIEEEQQQVVYDQNVQNYTVPIQNFNLAYSIAK